MLAFFEVAFLILVVIGAFSQIVIPAVKGTQLFPILGKKNQLYRELEEVKELQEQQDLLDQIDKLKAELAARKAAAEARKVAETK